MHFQIDHEIDAPIEAVEAALLSPDFGPQFGRKLRSIKSLQSMAHELDDQELCRVWRFEARAPLGLLDRFEAANEWLVWEERVRYQRADHRARWLIVPRGDDSPTALWRRYFAAQGEYRLEPLTGARTRRIVTGDLTVRIKLIGRLVERTALRELQRTYATEAEVVLAHCRTEQPGAPRAW